MMKSNFLNLPSSASGDARRHVPFRSIINKHISVLFVFVFVFSILFSYVYPVAALADPVFQPVYDTQLYQLPQFVDPLNSTQQDIFYFILGSQVVEYAGLSDYQIENPYSDPDSVGEWFKKIGIDLYNDVIESYAIAGAPVIAGAKWLKDLYANIAGAANFAGSFNNSSWNDWFSDVKTNGLSLNLYPSGFNAFNQYFAFGKGLYKWQLKPLPYSEIGSFSWRTWNMGAAESGYIDYINSNIVQPHVKMNITGSIDRYNAYMNDSTYIQYHNLFINQNNGYVYLCNDNGSSLGFYNYYLCSVTSWYNRIYNESYEYEVQQFSVIGYNTIYDAVEYIFSNPGVLFNSGGNAYVHRCYPCLQDLIQNIYYGTSWDNKNLFTITDDLNFSESNKQDTLLPIIDTLLDIKGLINDILDQNELKQPALDNLTDLNGNPLPASQLQPVSVAIELPDSGITINSGLFTPLTKDGGYINYLWYMTKPLVQYTSDFIQTLVFPDDTGEGFDATGPGMIVYGVICLGLIGGLVVKCLL